MKYAAFYGRYSCERQSEQSIEGQLNVCQKYAEQNGLKIIETYIDRAMTGTNDNRAEFQRMLADCEKSVLWDIVLVYAIDRFGRNSIEIAVNKQKLKKNHKMLISATQRTSDNIDGTKNLDGILLENVYIGLAEYYSAELSQKIRRGLHESRRKGYFTGGFLPYGYKTEPVQSDGKKTYKRIIIDEERADIVRFMFRQYSEGVPAREIIRQLTERGITYKTKPFAMNTVYHILRLEKYTGISRHDDGIYNNIFPPIISKTLFDCVQSILHNNKKGTSSLTTTFLLKGKLVCGLCGKHMQGDSGTSRSGNAVYYYKCMGRKRDNSCKKSILPKEKFDKLITEITYKLIGTKENIERIADEIVLVHKDKLKNNSVLHILQEQQNTIKKHLANIMKAIEQGIFNATTKARMDELEKQLSETQEKITLEQLRQQKMLTKEKIITFLTDGIFKAPQQMLYTLVQKIIVYDDKIEIFFNYTSKNETKKGNPDDCCHRDFLHYPGSDSSHMVEVVGIEPATF